MTRNRRLLMGAAAASLAWPALVTAQQTRSLKDPLRLGADQALMESGLAAALQRAFGRDTGVAVQLIGGMALPLLDTLERGEIDAALANAPEAELKLDKQGLVHDRQPIAETSMVLVGPAPAWPVFLILALELAVGGLDNLLSHHKHATLALAWGGRVLGVCALLAGALVAPTLAEPLATLAAAVSLVGVSAEFWRGRDYFLDKRIRDKAMREAAAHS